MLVERDTELTVLRRLLDDLGSSGGRVVLVRGEAGIGKSALVSQFLTDSGDRTHALVGGCDDLLTPQPLGPIWDVARHDAALAAPLSGGDRRAVMETLLDLLSRGLRPTVLVLEDTQWADEATLDVIKFLGRRIARTNGMLLLTYRDGEVDLDHPLRTVIGELPPRNIIRLQLPRLSREAVSLMIGPQPFDLDEIMALTAGIPLFVTEVIATGMGDVPISVRDSVLARAGKLSPEARRLLALVSVSPGGAERWLVDAIAAPSPDDLAECARQGLLRMDADAVVFHHELVRRAIESSLSASEIRKLNRRVLEELSGRADPSRLVHHARTAGDVDAIVEFAPAAARAAMAIESHREALAHFRTLEPHLDRVAEEDLAAIFDDWARNEFYLDNIEALDILDRAIALHRSTGDRLALARALTFAVRLNEVNGHPDAAEACSIEAVGILQAFPPGADHAFAISQQAWLALMRGNGTRGLELADDAIAMADAVGDELSMIHALNTKGYETYRRRDPTGLGLLEECRSRAEAGGYRFEETRALINMMSATANLRELELAGDFAQRARDTAARYEIRALEAYAQAHYAEVQRWKGDWGAAENLASEVQGSHPHVEVIAGWLLGSLQARRGRTEAGETLERAWSVAETSGEIQNLAPAASALAEHMWLSGEGDPARVARLREVLDEALSLEQSWEAGTLAFWLWQLDVVSVAPDGIAEPYRLVMSGAPAEAAAIWEAKGMPYERALALVHGPQPDQIEAIRILDDLGATATARRVRTLVAEKGTKVPRGRSRAARSHPAGLTARQAEVLELVAEGLTNAEIADRLFVSPRTVENHVAAILMKLDAPNRQAAVATARDRGVLFGH